MRRAPCASRTISARGTGRPRAYPCPGCPTCLRASRCAASRPESNCPTGILLTAFILAPLGQRGRASRYWRCEIPVWTQADRRGGPLGGPWRRVWVLEAWAGAANAYCLERLLRPRCVVHPAPSAFTGVAALLLATLPRRHGKNEARALSARAPGAFRSSTRRFLGGSSVTTDFRRGGFGYRWCYGRRRPGARRATILAGSRRFDECCGCDHHRRGLA